MIIGPNQTELPGAYPVRVVDAAYYGVAELEVWLLTNIGPGNTGDIDLMEEGDLWNLGWSLGCPTVYFVYERDYQVFLFARQDSLSKHTH